MRRMIFAALLVIAASCTSKPDYTSYVDVKLGSGGFGHVFVGASVPFGMVQLGPGSARQGWPWCSGYHDSDSIVLGFSHTHLSGTGCADLMDVTLMPVTGNDIVYARGNAEDPSSGIWSYCDKSTEKATPGYYSVHLSRYNVDVELTATERVGLSKFIFAEGAGDAAVVFNLADGNQDHTTDAGIEICDSLHITGWRHSAGWAKDQKLWFAAEFNKPFDCHSTHGDKGLFTRFDFGDDPGTVLVKVALSPTSCEAAKENLEIELPYWNFEKTHKKAVEMWNDELSKIDIETKVDSVLTIFYTSLYHTMISPALFSDCGQPNRYTVLSLWDTYRALMPLYTIFQPERENEMMQTFIELFEKEGLLPVWHLWGNETWCMIGNPGVIALADAVSKGFDGFDLDRAWTALDSSSMSPNREMGLRLQHGWIPSDLAVKSVAYETEYCVADWAVAQAAKVLGKDDRYEYYLNRSHNWRRHFDPETGFVRGITSEGKFREPFNPYYNDHETDDYCEGNAWQYTWLAPHDVDGIISNWGSREATLKALDSLFVADSRIEGSNLSPDISGMIGQYVHGNEPSHHIVYLYSMMGERDRTADLVRRICSEMYATGPEGLCGNEDAGQMSAWYILSSIGFYQAEPAGGRYYFGVPLLDKVHFTLPEGRSFTVKKTGEGNYIDKIVLNGAPYDLPYIGYHDIMAGGELEFIMR